MTTFALDGYSRTVRVGVYQNKPKIFIDEKGKASGFFVQLLQEIAKKEKWELVFVSGDWSSCLKALEDGRIDLMPDVAYTPQREVKYDLNKIPVLDSWSTVYASPRIELGMLSELNGKRIAVLRDSVEESFIIQLTKGFGYKVKVLTTDSFEQSFALVAKGSADLAIANQFFGDYHYQDYHLKKTLIILDPAKLFYATAQGRNADLVRAIDRHMGPWLKDHRSVYYRLLRHWLAKEPGYKMPQWLFWLFWTILGALAVAVLRIFLLHKKVLTRNLLIKQSGAKLKESSELFQVIFDNSTVGMSLTAADGNLLKVNQSFARMLGRTVEEMQTLDFTKITHPDDIAESREVIRSIIAGEKKDLRFEKRYFHKDGHIVWGEVSSTLYRDEKGQPGFLITSISDITERKRAEEALRNERDQAQRYLDIAGVMLAILDPVGAIVKINKKGCKILGYTDAAQLQGHNWFELCLPERIRGQVQSVFNKLMAGEAEAVEYYNNPVLTRSGDERTIAFHNTILRDQAGKITGVLFSGEDVTERDRAEENVRLEKEKLAILINSIPDEVWVADQNKHVALANPGVLKPILLEEEEEEEEEDTEKFTNKLKVLRPDGSPRPIEEDPSLKALAGEIIKDQEEIIRLPTSGKLRYRQINAAPIKDASGQIIGAVSVVRDISERKQAEEEMAKKNALLNAIINSPQDNIIFSLDKEYRYIAFNEKHRQEMLKIYNSEIQLGDNMLDKITLPEVKPLAKASYDRVLTGESFQDIQRQAGADIWYEFSWNPITSYQGEVIGISVMVKDISERKQAEEKIRNINIELEQKVQERTNELKQRMSELEAANKELEAFSYSVSHDLRAPLRGIDGFSGALLEDEADKLDEKGKDYLHRICASTRHMSQLIDDMLKLSKISSSDMQHDQVDLSTLANKVASELQNAQPERLAEFVIEPDLRAEGDLSLLKIVLENLMNNAWKFTAPHPSARIEFGRKELEGKPAYFLRDNGVGYNIAYADKLFSPFQRLHSTAEFPGTGIGLATVQRIIHRHGGRVWAEGEVEKGATVYFTLP
jgi:PAS domain S-box-containing protein